ncbi:hypothetical protein B0H12DRAFT_1097889 [Mycena haematopus]|nr:hypothetical protein B0H12DRAFT_1097889 [Mycena haematopus]
MAVENRPSHSFKHPFLVSDEPCPSLQSSHRRYNSEPFNAPPSSRPRDAAFSLFAKQPFGRLGEILLQSPSELHSNVHALAVTAPVPLRRSKLQYSICRPRPNTESFGISRGHPSEIVLGEPKEHVGHPKARIGQPVLKLAAIKERMELLEATNDRLQQRIESYKTDAEMLSSSVTYFSSEYYAGLLTIRDLRARSQQDAEIMSKQEQQLCQLKKFVGLMVEIGLHEPVLERAHQSVLAGQDFEPVLVEAIRNATTRRGSAWSGIISAVNLDAPPLPVPTISLPTPDMVSPTDIHDVFVEERSQSTVDDLLKDLKDGNIPFGRHRSASGRFPATSSPACKRSTSNNAACSKSPKGPSSLQPSRSPARCVLGKLDINRSSPQARQRCDRSKKTVPRTQSSAIGLGSTRTEGYRPEKRPLIESARDDTSSSNQRALASLQHLIDNFSSGSFGSLGTTTDETQSADYDSSAEPLPRAASPIARSPVRLRVRRPTVTKRASQPATSPARNPRGATAVPSPAKKPQGSPSRPCCRASDSRTTKSTATGSMPRKTGWR